MNYKSMNHQRMKQLYLTSKRLIKNEYFLRALNILIKISLGLKLYRRPPFKRDDILNLASICCEQLNRKSINEEALLAYGVILRNANSIEESIKVFDSVLSTKPNKEAILEKACSFEIIGENKKACSLLLKALKIYPFDKMVLNNLATLYENEGNLDLALNYYNLALDVDKTAGITYYNKGRVLYILDQFDEALSHFKTAIQLYDKSDVRIVDVYIFLGDSQFNLNQYKLAEGTYKEIISLFPKRGEGYFSLGEFYFNIGKVIQALNLIDKAIRYSPPNCNYYHKKALLLVHLNMGEKAISIIEKAFNYFPDDVGLLDLYGEINLSCANYNKAIYSFSKRLDIEADNERLYLLAISYFHIEDYSSSLYFVNQFIVENKSFVDAYILRAKINAITGYYHLAMADLYKVLQIDSEKLYLDDSDWYYFEDLLHIEEYQKFIKKVRR